MNRGEAARISSQDKSRGTLWFRTSLGQFLIDELRDFPGRRLAALRGFIVVMTIVLVSETLQVAPLASLAIALSMNFNPYLNAGQALILGVRQFGYTIVTVLVFVGALIFAGDAPWLLLPMSFIIMALALFDARLIAWPTAIALLYATSVLYSPSTPDENIYSALWNIPIIGVLAIGTWTLVQLTIQPQDPLKLLTESIAEQRRDVSGQALTLLPDETLPDTALLETSLSLLTALWRAMKRIAGLMLRRHHAFQIIW